MWRRRNRLSGLVLAICAGSTLARAQVIQGSDYPGVTQLDNAWIEHQYPIDSDESASANYAGYTYSNFWLFAHQSCEHLYDVGHPGDRLCGQYDPLGYSTRYATFDVAPSQQIPGFAPVFRMSGFNFGRVDSNITLVKVTDELGESGYDYQEHESPVTRVRLDREVIVVPVNVVVEAPYPGRPFSGEYARSVMELIAGSPRSFPALFDDERIGAVSGGGGATTEGTYNPARSVFNGQRGEWIGAREVVAPDEVFAQCGVQFRWVSTTILRPFHNALMRKPCGAYDPVDAPEGVIQNIPSRVAGEVLNLPQCLSETFTTAMDSVETISGEIVQDGLWVLFVSEIPGAYGQAGGSVAALDVTSAVAVNSQLRYVLAHEIGHVLGNSGHAGSPNLMRESFGSQTSDILGCSGWRAGVEHDYENVPLPLGCNPSTGAADHCSKARERAAELSRVWSGNEPPIVTLYHDGEEVLSTDTFTETKDVTCNQSTTVDVVVSSSPTDTTTALSPLSGWTVTSGEIVSEVGTTITVTSSSIFHRPTVKYTAIDIQGARTHRSVTFEFKQDEEGPEILVSTQVRELAECVSGQGQALAPPLVSDNCDVQSVAGRIISNSGQALNPPIELDEDGFGQFPAGASEIEWTAVDDSGNTTVAIETVVGATCVAAGQSMKIANQVSLIDSTGAPSGLMILGDSLTEIAGQATVGDVIAEGSVRIDGGARVEGNVFSGAEVTVQSGAVVTGLIRQQQLMTLPQAPTIPGPWPAGCGAHLHFNAGLAQPQAVAPGCYGSLSVGSGTKVVLESEHYYFASLTMEPNAVLVTSEGTIVDVRDQLTFRGRLENPSGTSGELEVRFRGTGSAYVDSSFAGSILAPNARLYLGSGPGNVFRGQFFARDLEIRSGVQVVGEPGQEFALQSVRPTFVGGVSYGSLEHGTCSLPGRVGPLGNRALLYSALGLFYLLAMRRRSRPTRQGVRTTL